MLAGKALLKRGVPAPAPFRVLFGGGGAEEGIHFGVAVMAHVGPQNRRRVGRVDALDADSGVVPAYSSSIVTSNAPLVTRFAHEPGSSAVRIRK